MVSSWAIPSRKIIQTPWFLNPMGFREVVWELNSKNHRDFQNSGDFTEIKKSKNHDDSIFLGMSLTFRDFLVFSSKINPNPGELDFLEFRLRDFFGDKKSKILGGKVLGSQKSHQKPPLLHKVKMAIIFQNWSKFPTQEFRLLHAPKRHKTGYDVIISFQISRERVTSTDLIF